MPLGDHLEELRSRLIRCIIVLAGAFIVCWAFRLRVMALVTRPHRLAMEALELDPQLKFRSYTEPLVAQLKACLIVGAILSAPFIIYQAWKFVMPALFRHERRWALKLGLVSFVCLAAGVCFGYFLFIPLALRFLLGLAGTSVEPVLMIGAYLSLFFMLTLALGVVFQTPVVMYYLVRWGIVNPEGLRKNRKVAILSAFVLAAFLTPPDPFTQMMMAVPLIVLYDVGALAAAPSRATALSLLRFAATVGAIAALFAAWFFLWPVGQLTAVRGAASVGRVQIEPPQTVKVRRGQLCAAAEGTACKLSLGRGKSALLILMAGPATVQVHSASSISLYRGCVFAKNAPGTEAKEVRSRPATVLIKAASAELCLAEPGSLTVTVAEGEVEVNADGQRSTITAGRTATFQPGGLPTDASELQSRWNRLLEGEEGETPQETGQ